MKSLRMSFMKPLCVAPTLLLALVLVAALPASAATIVIQNLDGPGEGFNDPTVVAPVGNNPGATLGAQRLNVFQAAADVWSELLESDVTIVVASQFNPQTCTPQGATLGSAGTNSVFRDFPSAILAGTWYHSALADSLEGTDQDPGNQDINATFNSQLDTGCLGPGTGWYYGMTANTPGNLTNLFPVVLHEIAHGLGFANLINESNGVLFNGFPDVYTTFTFDNTQQEGWNTMTNAERVASAINTGNVVWTGPNVTNFAGKLLGNPARFTIDSPGAIAGEIPVQESTYSPAVPTAGITGDVVLAIDGAGADVNDGCEALTNGGAVSGNFCLVNRGNCPFLLKSQNCDAVGAIGTIVTNNVSPGLPPMGGDPDPSLAGPSVGISQADGDAIKAQLPGVTVTLDRDSTELAGTDGMGRVLLNAPNPVQLGSSISHYDPLTTPNTLMEPAINADLFDGVDLTVYHFQDIGWAVTQILKANFDAGNFQEWDIIIPVP